MPNEDGDSLYCHTHSDWQVVTEAQCGDFALLKLAENNCIPGGLMVVEM